MVARAEVGVRGRGAHFSMEERLRSRPSVVTALTTAVSLLFAGLSLVQVLLLPLAPLPHDVHCVSALLAFGRARSGARARVACARGVRARACEKWRYIRARVETDLIALVRMLACMRARASARPCCTHRSTAHARTELVCISGC